MGSANDKPKMQPAGAALQDKGIRYEVRVMSAHRDPEKVREYCHAARMRGLRVIIAGAGMSAALPGVAAAHTDLPVIGVPLTGKSLGGLDALLSAVQMPPGVPVGCVAIDGAKNAGLLAARIIVRDRALHPPRDGRGMDGRTPNGGLARVELAATEAWAAEGVVPSDAATACSERASFTVEAVEERERETGHYVAAFVDVVAASIGPEGRWIHYGLTSSDVLDTALALQLRDAGERILAGAREYRDALIGRALEHRETIAAGRTHGVHAEPTTFGLRLAGFAFEAERNLRRLERAFEGVRVGKLSGGRRHLRIGAPGGRAPGDGLARPAAEEISTQVVPRDRHAEVCATIALAGAGLERFATEIRNLQRTEVREVEEPWRHPEGLLGDAPQAQPDPRRAALRLRPGPAWLCPAATRTWPCGTSATSPIPVPSG